jgi:hypothetical protein
LGDLACEAERLKLARVLNTNEASLAFLGDCDPATLRVIRKGVTDALFAKFRPRFAGFARVSAYLPLIVSAKIAQRVLGPLLAGRIAGEMPPKRVIALPTRLPDAFLAYTCLQMEPERAQDIVADFPVARAVTLTRILLARNEAIIMGRFVDVLPEPTLIAATDAIEIPVDLLTIGLFVEDGRQLERVFTHLSAKQRDRIIQTAAERDLWPSHRHPGAPVPRLSSRAGPAGTRP